jgi:hypothetical protein
LNFRNGVVAPEILNEVISILHHADSLEAAVYNIASSAVLQKYVRVPDTCIKVGVGL